VTNFASMPRLPRRGPGDQWYPDGDEPQVADGAEMGDDAWAGGCAYGVTFLMPSAPGSTLTIWTYAVRTARSDRDYYELGYRLDHCHDGGPDGEPWTCIRYEHGSRLSCSVATIETRAAALVADLASSGLIATGEVADRGFFSWDGAPW